MSSSLPLARLSALAAACAVFSVPVAAQTTQTVTTVASRLPLSADRLAADVVVITADELRRLPQDQLADVLQQRAGVQVSRTGGPGQPTSVLIRGASAANTLVLVDGLRVGSGTLGQLDFSVLDLQSIERIEVLRGPGASLYGADAVGGVVLVTTRHAQGGAHTFAQAQVGQLGSTELGLAHGWRGPQADLQFSLNRQRSEGVSAVRPNDRFGLYNPDRDGYTRSSAQLQGGWTVLPGHRLGASLFATRLNSQYDSAEFNPPDFAPDASPDFRSRTTTRAAQARYDGRLGAEWTVQARWGDSLDRSTSGGSSLSRFQTQRREQGLQLQWSPGATLQTVVALDRLEERGEASDFAGPVARDNQALTVSLAGQWGDISLHADGRHDDNSVYGGNDTARAGARWRLSPGTSLRVLAATTFRAPSFNDLYFPGYGVATLKPESGRSLEAGLDTRLAGVQWGLTVWRNRVRDLIAYASDPADCPNDPAYSFGCAANIGRARLSGATLEANGALRGGEWRAGYDHTRAVDGSGQPLPRRARHQLRLGADHALGDWRLGGTVLWQSRREESGAALRGHSRVDLLAQRPLGPAWSLQLKLLNALNTDWEAARDYQAPRRQAFVGLRWDLR